ncbi:hypothetical protein F4604DRAFT_1922222 [Suillus subluteus]|nr:hypothetical protein F4604DRAFT_1922222 [Suillus subluteus]
MAITPPRTKQKLPTSTVCAQTSSRTSEMLRLIPGPGRFTIPSLAALHTLTFAQGFSNNERQVATRALLRHNAHIDGTHYHTRKPAGLHPAYVAFNNETNGSEVSSTISPEELALDLYITPHELQETPQRISGDVAALVQAFAAEFALPHLQCFSKRCTIENIKPPKRFPTAHINAYGPQYLPAPMVATGAHIQCSAQSPQAFSDSLQVKAQSKILPIDIPSVAIHAFVPGDNNMGPLFSGQELSGPKFGPPLISIGANTDAALDRLVFRSPRWDLTYEQATILSKALLTDLQVQLEVIKYRSSSVLTVTLKVLRILVFKTMVSHSFNVIKNVSAGRHAQMPIRTHPKVVLSKEDALDDAWNQLDQATKTIAMSHHKSVHHMQNDLYIGRGLLHSRHSKLNAWNAFCWKKNQETENCNQGRGALKSLIQEHRDEYLRLSMDEQDNILAEYADWKKTKVTGLRVSTKSKVNDISQTLKAVQNKEQLDTGEIVDRHRRTRSDKGTKCKGLAGATNPSHRKKYKSSETVEDEEDEEEDEPVHQSPTPAAAHTVNHPSPSLAEDQDIEPVHQSPALTAARSNQSSPMLTEGQDHQSCAPAAATHTANNLSTLLQPFDMADFSDASNTPNLGFYVPRDSDMASSDFSILQFDCDAALAALDQMFGSAP